MTTLERRDRTTCHSLCRCTCGDYYEVHLFGGLVNEFEPESHDTDCNRPKSAHKPAEPPAFESSLDGFEPIGFQPAEPQSEPPIDSDGIAYACQHDQSETGTLARAYLALKAERDALNAEVLRGLEQINSKGAALAKMTRDNAALKARVEELEGVIVDYREAGNAIGGGRLDRGMDRQIDYARVNAASRRLNETADIIRARKEQEASNGK